MNKIYTKGFRNAIGIGARAFRSDYEGGVILLGEHDYHYYEYHD